MSRSATTTTTKGSYEKSLIKQKKTILGIDEVGRGCLAGPVYASCVSLDFDALQKLDEKEIDLIRDSKKLSTKQRQRIIPILHEIGTEIKTGKASVREIETYGILDATFLAMRRAIISCDKSYDMVLIDGNKTIPNYHGEQKAIVQGDLHCFCIAAASIIAKEARDDYMRKISKKFPNYGFEKHVGYGTKMHMESIESHGICPLHRKNFAPIAKRLDKI